MNNIWFLKALEIKFSILFDLAFSSNIILYNVFLLLLKLDLYFLIPAGIPYPQILNPTAELAMHMGTKTNEVNAKIERQALAAEAKISNLK